LQALIGQKYGYRPFPSVIKSDVFEAVRTALLGQSHDVTQLDMWFKKDTNVLPAVYTLQPISSILKHFKDKVSSLSYFDCFVLLHYPTLLLIDRAIRVVL